MSPQKALILRAGVAALRTVGQDLAYEGGFYDALLCNDPAPPRLYDEPDLQKAYAIGWEDAVEWDYATRLDMGC